MPEDWRDAEGWEIHHQASIGTWQRMRVSLEALIETVERQQEKGVGTVWVPGCGRSPLGRIMAHLGLQVVVSDVSPAAIQHQSEAHLDLEALGAPRPNGSFEAHVHDFRLRSSGRWSPPSGAFGWIVNEAAIQGFTGEDLIQVAHSHADALGPAGEAWFVTQNVQGTRRDVLEEALEAAGLVVPYAELYRRYRAALRAVDPDFIEILGHPQGRDRAQLNAVLDAFVPIFEAAGEAEVARAQGARLAVVIYSTG